jgi:CspA family cold shock protein
MPDRRTGTVKWFSDLKGYGFIELEPGRDVFVHYSVIDIDGYKTLEPGQVVEFDMEMGPKGIHALHVSTKQTAQADG